MKIGIIGAGIAGLTAAIALKNKGFAATVYEAAPEILPVGAGLALAANAIKAFRKLGIAEEVMAAGHCLSEFRILDQEGQVITVTDTRLVSEENGLDNCTIHRANLHEVLLNNIPAGSLLKNKKAISVSQTAADITISFQGGTMDTVQFLIVADGIHSPIRNQLVPTLKTRYAGYTCWRAVIENPGIFLDAATETWGTNGRVGVVPLKDNKIYWFACVNAPEQSKQYKSFRIKDVQNLFKGYHSPLPEIMAHTTDAALLFNDIIDLPEMEHYNFGNIVIIGDAAHATTPNLGQGACQAIEDGLILMEELSRTSELNLVTKNFSRRRLARTQWIIKDSYRIGRMAQLQNSFLIKLRNFVLRQLPKSINEKQVKRLYRVDF